MSNRIRVLAFAALAAACQAGPQSVSAVNQGQGTQSSAIQLTVSLVVLSENPTPVGLPTSLLIAAPKLPRAGEAVAVTWRALDGDAGPREGTGSLELDADNRLVATLTASGRAASEALILSGTDVGGTVRGTFGDRLFFRRAGRFEGTIREQ